MLFKLRLVVLLLSIICSLRAHGQDIVFQSQLRAIDNFSLKKWSIEDGLPQNTITDIHQTRDGYLWVTTFGGLVRFDGRYFTNFNIGNSKGLVSNRSIQLFEDHNNRLWVLHENFGASIFQNDSFIENSILQELANEDVRSVVNTKNGKIWIGTAKNLYIEEEDSISLFAKDLFINKLINIGNNKIAVVAGEIGYDQRELFLTSGNKIQKIGTFPKTCKFFQGASDSELWITSKNRLYRQSLKNIHHRDTLNLDIQNLVILNVFTSKEGNVWLSTTNGAYRYPPFTATNQHTISQFDVHVLENNTIRNVFEDKAHNIWIGTEGNGLYYMKNRPINRFEMPQATHYKGFDPIATDGHGGMWVGSPCELLFHYRNGTFKTIPTPKGCIGALVYDPKNDRVLISISNKVYSIQNETFELLFQSDVVGYENQIKSLFISSKDEIWMGTVGNGILKYAQGKVNKVLPKEVVKGRIYTIVERKNGDILFGSDNGIIQYNPEGINLINVQNGLSPGAIRSIYEDKDAVLWVGSYGGGMSRIKKDSIFVYDDGNGLKENVVSRIHEDQQNRLWILGNLGLYAIDKSNLNDYAKRSTSRIETISFGTNEGMTEGNGAGVVTTTSDGLTWWPTINGIAAIDVDKFLPEKSGQLVKIASVQIQNQRLDSIPFELVLNSEQRDFQVSYTSLNFTAPEKVQYKHKLLGYDAVWIYDGTKTDINYTNLPPGAYTLLIYAANQYGIWGDVPLSLNILIKPKYYEITWIRNLSLVVLFAMLLTFYKWRTSNLKRRRKELEALTLELSSSNKELAQYNTKLEQFTFITAHNFRGPIARLLGLTHVFKLNGSDNTENLKIIDHIMESSQELDQIITDLNMVLELRSGKEQNIEPVLLSDKLEEAKKMLATKIEFSKATIQTNLNNKNYVDSIGPYIGSIFFNLLSNAIKYKHPDRPPVVKVHSSLEVDMVKITFEDNGLGMDIEAHADKLFKLYNRFHDHVQGKGMGLYLIKTQAELLGGYVRVESKVGQGTSFFVYIKKSLREGIVSDKME